MAHRLAEAEGGFRHLAAGEHRATAHAPAWRRVGAADAVAQAYFLDQRRRNLADEARDLVVGLVAVQAAGLGVGQHQLLHGAGHADIGQAALFLEAAGLFQAHLVREQALFHADQEHQGELQALGAVQGHQLHAVLVFLGLGIAGFQRGVGEEGGQRAHLLFLVLEVARGADQFLQVFHPRLGLLAFLGLVPGDQPALLDDGLGHQVQRHVQHLGGEVLDQLDETAQRPGGAAGQGLVGDQLLHRRPHRQVAVAGVLADGLDGLLADATGRHVDHPLQRGVVVAAVEQAQVGHRVLDLGALEEALAAVDAVGNLLAQQGLFQHPRLGVGAVEDGDLAALETVLAQRRLDRLDYVARLVVLVEGGVQADRLAVAAVGPQLLAEAPVVVGDQRVGGLEDAGGGAVVLLQADQLGIGEVATELLDVLDLGAAPAVDRLVVVADHHQALAALGEQAQPGVLHGVGVLELVDQDVAEALLVVRQQVGLVAPQVQRAQQQLGEIDHSGARAGVFIGLVDLQHGGEEQVAAGLDILRPQALVLLPVDEPLRLLGRPALLVQAQLADHPFHQALLVVGVEDLEVLAEPGFLPVRAQDAVGQAVEGADPHAGRALAEHLLDALAHLGRRLVGEGHRQDRVGRGVEELDQEGDAVHQHAGLA